MLCPICFGKGYTYTTTTVVIENTYASDKELCDYKYNRYDGKTVQYDIQVPCEECHGTGIINCCEGLIINE